MPEVPLKPGQFMPGLVEGLVGACDGDQREVPSRPFRSSCATASDPANFRGLVFGAAAVRIPDKSSKTDGAGSSLPDLVK